jgi:RND family efflux transporter MFP subunit
MKPAGARAAGGFGAAALSLGLLGCGSAQPQATAVSEPERPPVNVRVLRIELSELPERIELAGRLEPWIEVSVATELGGTVEAVGFEKGDRVKEGQVLARISTDLYGAALAEAEADLAAAEANFTKTTQLFEREATTRQDLVAATARHQMAQARVTQARLRKERSILRAPVAGVAVSRELELGEVVSPGAAITVLHQIDRPKAVVGIPENDIAFFRRGGEASVEVDAYPGKVFPGRIHFLGPAATGQNRTFPAEVEVTDPGRELRSGMIARVQLVKRRFRDAVVVARDALVERDQGLVALLLDGDRARVRRVVVGPRDKDRVVVQEGLAPGEMLIVSGQRDLIDGQPVRVVSP